MTNEEIINQQVEDFRQGLIRELAKKDFDYPIVKRTKGSGLVIKFTGLEEGVVLFGGTSKHKLGMEHKDWMPHTYTDYWDDVAYDKDRGLYDKQFVECWNNKYTTSRDLCFYDAINKCAFSCYGTRMSSAYDNYEATDYNPKWAEKAYGNLDD